MIYLNNLIANPLLLGFIILTLATLILLGLVLWMFLKMRKFLVGIDSKHIGDSLTVVSSGLKDMQEFRSDLEKYLTDVEKRLRRSVQSVHTVRFNPFKGTGGGSNQSFATAFINEEGDGVVISSLYSRDHVSIFAKPVKKHVSEYELSGEEKEALE
ncbi:MAG: DUF4446 family protein, partial [Patescibacteria group bacterium]